MKKIITAPSYATNNIQSLATRTKNQAAPVKLAHDQTGIDIKAWQIVTLLAGLSEDSTATAGAYAIGADGTFGTDNVGDEIKAIDLAIMQVISDGIAPGTPGYFLKTNDAGTSVEWDSVDTSQWVKPLTDIELRVQAIEDKDEITSVVGPNGETYSQRATSSTLASSGVVDNTKAFCETVTTTTDNVDVSSMINGDITDFKVGQEITMQDATLNNKEDLIIQSIADPTITFTTTIQNTYASGANVYRSNTKVNGQVWRFGGFGKGIIGYDLTIAAYDSVSFSVSGQDTNPSSVTFNNDGTKMYMAGISSDNINEYDLSVPFDLSTAVYNGVNLSVNAQDSQPNSAKFSQDGTKMFMMGRANGNVYQYTLSAAWDLSTASYDSKTFYLGTQDTAPNDIDFNLDGTRMFMVGENSDTVHQYTLSTAYDVSTLSYDSVSFSVSGEETSPQSVVFNNDGTKMFIAGIINDTAYAYDLSTGFDLSTTSYSGDSFSMSSEDGTVRGIAFNGDGTKMYMVGDTNNRIYQYTSGIDDNTEVLDIDIRININAWNDKSQIIAFLETNDFDTVTLDGSLSIRASGADEVYVDTEDVKTDEGTNNMYMSAGSVATPEKLATMKYKLTRASTSDAVTINRVQGGLVT